MLNEQVSKNGPPNLKKILVGKKCDLEDKREVKKEKGKELSDELGFCNFFEVSAKTGENVEEAFMFLLEEIYYKLFKTIILNDKDDKHEKNTCAK